MVLKKETALKRIRTAVNKECKNETQAVKNYIVEVIYLTFENLELDTGAIDENGRPYTSTKNLKFAIEINLEDDYDELVQEARREAKKLVWTNPIKKGVSIA